MARSYPRQQPPKWRSEAREGTVPARLFEKLGKAIRHERLGQQLTQEQLAEEAKLSPQHLLDIEHGRSNVTLASLVGIARGLGMKVHELLAKASV